MVLALVGAFTVVGTVVAVLLGLLAILRIHRERERLAGTGYAVFGIVWGLAFTALSLFAFSTGELFGVADQLRARAMAGNLEDPADLRLVQEKDGFRIDRPSHQWRVAREALRKEMENDSALLLANPRQDAYLDVSVDRFSFLGLEAYADRLLDSFRDEAQGAKKGADALHRTTGFKLLDRRLLPPGRGIHRIELRFEVKILNQPVIYLVRIIKEDPGRVFVVRSWAARRRFVHEEPELRALLDSFHSLAHPED
jgi:hypothetical protein